MRRQQDEELVRNLKDNELLYKENTKFMLYWCPVDMQYTFSAKRIEGSLCFVGIAVCRSFWCGSSEENWSCNSPGSYICLELCKVSASSWGYYMIRDLRYLYHTYVHLDCYFAKVHWKFHGTVHQKLHGVCLKKLGIFTS